MRRVDPLLRALGAVAASLRVCARARRERVSMGSTAVCLARVGGRALRLCLRSGLRRVPDGLPPLRGLR